jgi:hypothetical protein
MNGMRYATRVDAVLRCGLKRVDAVRTGSIQILIRNWNPCKNCWTWPPNFFLLYCSHGILRNWHGLWCGSMRVKPSRYGFLRGQFSMFTHDSIACPRCGLHKRSAQTGIAIYIRGPWGLTVIRWSFNVKIWPHHIIKIVHCCFTYVNCYKI